MCSAAPLSSDFFFDRIEGADDSMIEFAKNVILLAFKEYPSSEKDWEKCVFVSNKFGEKYGGNWSISFIKNGDVCFWSKDYYIKLRYNDYKIKIGKIDLI